MSVTVRGLSVRLGGKQILERVDATFSPGLTAIKGPSGAGKSTLLGAIAGRVPLSAGTVSKSDPGPVGWIFQSAPSLLNRTTLDNVALGPMSTGVSHPRAKLIAMEKLVELRMEHCADQPVYRLSGGERQRVAIARELTRGSGTVLADEPTAALDARSRELICEALRALSNTGATVIIATHDEFVSEQCDVTYVLDDGYLDLA
ncbi:ATP-binding cassette domain-containing protein [Pseudolysinimonas sp.]|jgi:ABC-type lipoprotein export system ATPase subunit|uniref:ATP-binding cassette domain-containing protein n=1 Tax=Pseudolysinimonas sp. TaxID=2680009 RepID=UPI00378340A3